MAQEKIKEVIVQLKEMKERKNLSIDQIIEALDSTNNHLAKNTVVKFFSEGSEDCGYQYETIRAISDVMLNVYSDDADDDDEVRGLKRTVQLQNILIDQLKEQIQKEKIDADSILQSEKESNMRRIEFLRDRVNRQDHRIEQKDRLLAIMMIIVLKKLDPDLISGCGLDKYYVDTMKSIGEYLNGEE